MTAVPPPPSSPSTPPDPAPAAVSVVVLTKNRLAKLTRCLERLLPQLSGADEVVVADTGSTDGTVERFADPPARVRFFRFAGEGSWAEARNFAVDRAANPLVAFLDDDCYVAPGWVERGRTGLAHADALGGLVVLHGDLALPPDWDPENGWLVGISVPGHRGPEAGRYFYPYTSNLWLRGEVARAERFQELGGEFAEREGARYVAGREDAELWRRLRVRGRRTAFDPGLVVEHHVEADRFATAYLRERAERDGEAWARREGRAEDLAHVAYGWWTHAVPQGAAERTRPRAAFHALMRARQRAALRALSEKIAEEKLRTTHAADAPGALKLRTNALLEQGVRFAWHRAKDLARKTALALDPPRRWNPPEVAPERVSVCAFAFLGDLVLLQAMLRGLAAARPGLALQLIAPPASREIFRDFEHSLPGFRLEILPTETRARAAMREFLAARFAEFQPQAILAPYLHDPWGSALVRLVHSLPKTAPLVAFAGDVELRRRIDVERIPRTVAKDLTIHEIENLRRLFADARLPADPLPAAIEPRAEALDAMRRTLDPEASPLVAINPDAGKPNKEWTDEAWAETIAGLAARLPARRFVVNLSRPRPELEARLETLEPAARERTRLLRGEPLDRLIAALSLCESIVTVDAGPQHLAHALGVPSLTLYGPMDERRWADAFARPIHRTIRGGMFDLTPEETRGLPENHLMRLIRPERVVAAATEPEGNRAVVDPPADFNLRH